MLPLIATSALLGLTGCGKKRTGDLFVTVYDGGYGTDWIKQVAEDYEAKTGIKVSWSADQTILDRLSTELDAPSSDIYMSHDIGWQGYAEQGLLEELDDLYASEVEGTGKTFKDRLCAGAEEISKLNDHYYKVCYTQGAGGLVYNVKMFQDNGWTVPTTYAELQALCQQIVDAKVPTSEPGTKVVPIAWSGADREYYWDYIVFEWWAQLAGEEKINQFKSYKVDGTYGTGYEVFNPSTYHKEFVDAYNMWHSLIAQNPSYSNNTPQSAKLVSASSMFANGMAAMIPYAQWAKYEIQNSTGTQFAFDVAMMKTPKATAESQDFNYNVGFGDSIIIPKNISDDSKAKAKDFLRYLAGKEACKTFVDKARGAFLAFDYSIVDLGDLLQDTYIKSINEKLTTCKNFNLVSMNPVAYMNSSAIMPWINNVYYYSKAFAEPTNDEYKAPAVGAKMYETAQSGWKNWVKKAGVSD